MTRSFVVSPDYKPPGPPSNWIERADRAAFLQFYPRANLPQRAYLRTLYQPCYPHWPEFAARHELPGVDTCN